MANRKSCAQSQMFDAKAKLEDVKCFYDCIPHRYDEVSRFCSRSLLLIFEIQSAISILSYFFCLSRNHFRFHGRVYGETFITAIYKYSYKFASAFAKSVFWDTWENAFF